MTESQQDTNPNDTGSISGDSTITMLTATPSPPPSFLNDLSFHTYLQSVRQSTRGSEEHREPSETQDSGVAIRSTVAASPAPSVDRESTFEEFMGAGLYNKHKRALSEESTIILDRSSARPDSGQVIHHAPDPNPVMLSKPPGGDQTVDNHTLDDYNCTMRDNKGKCICFCTAACFIQENKALASEISNLFPNATIPELSSLKVSDIVERFLATEGNPEQLGNMVAEGPPNGHSSSGSGGNDTHNQPVDPFRRDRIGIEMLLVAHEHIEAQERQRQSNTQPKPTPSTSTAPRTHESHPETGNTVNAAENVTEEDLEMQDNSKLHDSDETLIDPRYADPETEDDVDMTNDETGEYVPSEYSDSSSE